MIDYVKNLTHEQYNVALLERDDKIERLTDALQQIEQWSQAYPHRVFPEPDLKRAAELLKAGGISLDAVSASMARHVIEGVGRITREALSRHD